jgi:hypothetical protein
LGSQKITICIRLAKSDLTLSPDRIYAQFQAARGRLFNRSLAMDKLGGRLKAITQAQEAFQGFLRPIPLWKSWNPGFWRYDNQSNPHVR